MSRIVKTRSQAKKEEENDIDEILRLETAREELEVSRAIKEEQENAFNEALKEDIRKMKEKEEEERRKLLQMKKDEESKKKLHEEIAIAHQQLVEEPGEEDDCVIRVRMKMAGGLVERRFMKEDRMKNILDWVVCQGVGRGQFRLLYWPDLDISKIEEDTRVGDVFREKRVVLVMEMVEVDTDME